ncbi:hypothetical protein [Deinococcus sp. 6GRE01]|uniref:hypothetical protein n=1 Tax=Deinococcus sp. 6GRE01 TaxID=2745873 RepID=UPI001E34BB19|nr:hypothetical protein [Deinococcus sp. 6GRE01]MCD0156006.1 hypothetical protein [Deinococcus sp. 6GRE01]
MGLLHSATTQGARAALWELAEVVQASDLPLPPALARLDLPALSGAIGSGNPQALLGILGAELGGAMGEQLRRPEVQTLMRGDLTAARDSLLGYVAQLDTLKAGVLEQLAEQTGTLGALGTLRDTLSGPLDLLADLPGALADATGTPLIGTVLDRVAQASPEVAQVLKLAAGAAGQVERQLSGAQATLDRLQKQLADLLDLRTAAALALDAADGELAALDDLFASLEDLLP